MVILLCGYFFIGGAIAVDVKRGVPCAPGLNEWAATCLSLLAGVVWPITILIALLGE